MKICYYERKRALFVVGVIQYIRANVTNEDRQ